MSKLQPNKNILVLISGSIAAYKTCFVISKLAQVGHSVQVVTTPQALNFIGPSTLEGLTGKAVLSETFAPHHAMDHIHLARWADLILLCPATANTINKMAQGIADDLVTNLFLAHDFKKPFIVAPAMNSAMYQHPCTQSSLERLQKMGVKILEPGEGSLACGEIGSGRLMEPEDILSALNKIISELKVNPNMNRNHSMNSIPQASSNHKMTGEIKEENSLSKLTSSSLSPLATPALSSNKILITSGGTQEPIDAMRVLTNLSTGQTGAFLAEAFWDQGYEVHYLGASNAIKPQRPCTTISFTTFNDLNEKLKDLLSKNSYQAVVHAAAVSDFSVSKVSSAGTEYKDSSLNLKIPSHEKLTIELEPNFKILPRLKSYAQKNTLSTNTVTNISSASVPPQNTAVSSSSSPLPLIVGFKFTSTTNINERSKAVEKLFNEGDIDLVVHNDRHDIDKSKGQHSFILYSVSEKVSLPNPLSLAEVLLEKVFQTMQNQKKGSTL